MALRRDTGRRRHGSSRGGAFALAPGARYVPPMPLSGEARVFFAVAALLLLGAVGCGSGDDDGAIDSARPTLCGPLSVEADAVEPIELLFGATNVNAALGDGGLTAGFSSCGELTVLKWPGPSYYDQIDYLSSNAEDARRLPRHGALPGAGAFAGISYETKDGVQGLSWLRDPPWRHRQSYDGDGSGVLVQVTEREDLGLRVRARHFVLPGTDVLVSDFQVERGPDSQVRSARLVYYSNLAPTLQRLPLFPVADWALDFQNDYVALYDERRRAFLHFVPGQGGNRDFSPFNALLRDPPEDEASLLAAVDALVDAQDGAGVYLALAPRGGEFEYQVGFDDSPVCAHQSAAAERTIAGLGLPPALADVARTQFVCDIVVPQGPLARCRADNGWTYEAESAYADAADGVLSGSPLAACRANLAFSQPLDFSAGEARATVYLAAAATRDQAFAALDAARAGDPDRQRADAEGDWSEFLSGARLPDSDDPLIDAFAKRALISLRTALDRASGGVVASVTTQPPYGADWPRDGAFLNHALDVAGFTDLVSRHNRFYARVQRRAPAPWSLLYSFPACDPAAPVYPNCIPPGTVEMNYYADPDEVVPAGPNSFEIDEAALLVWTLWDHVAFLTDAAARSAYLDDVCPAIERGAENLAACRDPQNGLQCFANEDDNTELTQGLQGAETVLLALRSAVAAGDACAFAPAEVAFWAARAAELREAIFANFLVPGPPAHLQGARRAWALWPVEIFAPGSDLARSHAASLQADLDPVLQRAALRAGYNGQALLARAKYFRAVGDQAGLHATREQVRFFVHELTTPDTLHMAEFYVRVPADLNGDGVAPDYLQANAVPHVWEQSFLYLAAMEAFGAR